MKATFNNSQIENNFQVFFRAADDAAALLRMYYHTPTDGGNTYLFKIISFSFLFFLRSKGGGG